MSIDDDHSPGMNHGTHADLSRSETSASKWQSKNRRKRFVPQKEQMPPEHVRKIIKDHGVMASNK